MTQAATGLPPEKPKSSEMHFIRRSWFSYERPEKWTNSHHYYFEGGER